MFAFVHERPQRFYLEKYQNMDFPVFRGAFIMDDVPFKKIPSIFLSILFLFIGFLLNIPKWSDGLTEIYMWSIYVSIVLLSYYFLTFSIFEKNSCDIKGKITYKWIFFICYFSAISLIPCKLLWDHSLSMVIVFFSTILIWSIVVCVLTSERNVFVNFIASFWLVSGILITIGLSVCDFSYYPIKYFYSICNNFLFEVFPHYFDKDKFLSYDVKRIFDIRMLFSFLMAFIFIIQAVHSVSSNRKLPAIPMIYPVKISLPEFLKAGFIRSILSSAIYLPNILISIVVRLLNIVWSIVAVMSILCYYFIEELLIKLKEFFFSQSFLIKLGCLICLACFVFISSTWELESEGIIEYVRSKSLGSDIQMITSEFGVLLAIQIVFMLVAIFSIYKIVSVYVSVCKKESFLMNKIVYVVYLFSIFGIVGWMIYFLKVLGNFENYGFSSGGVGLISLSMGVILVSVILFSIVSKYVIKKG